MADKVRVVSPDGKRGEVPAANLMEAISQGYTPESEYDADQRKSALQAEHGDLAGQLQTGAQGLARGLTVGLSDVGSAALTGGALALGNGAPQLTAEARQRMAELGMRAPDRKSDFATGFDAAHDFQNNLREANPGIAVGTEAAGALLPTVASGGLAYAPAALAERAGAAVAKRVAGAAPGLARAGVAGAARGGVEGGLAGLTIGATRLHTDATPEEAAESIISAGTEGLLIGGGIGGILGTAGRALTGAGQRMDDAAGLAARADAPTEVIGPGQRHPADIDGITLDLEARPLSAAQLPDTRVRGKFATLMERQHAAQGGFEQSVQDGTAAVRADFDGVLREINAVDEWAGIAAKRRANQLNVGHPVATAEVDQLMGGLDANTQAFRARNSDAALAYDGGLNAFERVNAVMADSRAQIGAALQRGDIGEAYSQLDGMKRLIGRARGTRSGSVQDLMEGQYKQVQQFMEDESLWGELAQRQKVANAAWSNRISAGKDARLRSFTSRAGGNENRAANEWDQLDLANSGQVHSLLSNVGDVRIADAEEAFRRNLRSMARDATERTKAWGSPELQQKAVGIVNGVKRIEDRMDALALQRRDMLVGQQQLKGTAMQALGSVVGVVNPAAGFAIKGTVGMGRGLLGAVSDAGIGIRARVAQSAAQLVRGAGVVATVGATKAPVIAGSSGGMLSQEQYQHALQESQALSQAGSPQTQQLIAQGAEMEREDPALADAYVSRQIQRADYIASKLPKMTSAAIFAPKPVLDPVTDRKLQRTVNAAYAPAAAIERIARLMGTPEDVDALKKLYPAMYKSFQQQVTEHMQQLDKPLDYQTAVKVAQLTGLTTVPGMTPQSIARAQKAAAGPDQVKKGEAEAAGKRKAAAPNMGGRDRDDVYASNVDKVLDRE